MAQRLGVVGAEALDVVGLEAGALEGERDPRELERLAVGEDVALGERPGLGSLWRSRAMPWLSSRPPGFRSPASCARVDVDLVVADVLDHPDAGDRVEPLAGDARGSPCTRISTRSPTPAASARCRASCGLRLARA